MSREAFGRRLRRFRLRTGISLEQISAETCIPVELFAALEENDVSAWPSGIYARAYIRQYARAIGLDEEETVDEFCRWFPNGNRRYRPVAVEHSALIQHVSTWTDDMPQSLSGVDRRISHVAPAPPEPRPSVSPVQVMLARLRRAFGRA